MLEYLKENDWKVIKILLIITCIPYPLIFIPTLMSLAAAGSEKNIFVLIFGLVAWGLVLLYPLIEFVIYKYAKTKLNYKNRTLAYTVALWPYVLVLLILFFGNLARLI